MENLDKIQKDIEERGTNVGDSHLLFLDVSSTCTGYAIVSVDFINKRAHLKKAGVLWLSDKWSHQEKYSYMFNAILTYFEVVEQVDYIIHESYAINMNQRSGVMVVPEMLGAIKVGAAENNTKVGSFSPQSWRKQLEIKPKITADAAGKKHRDYKEPCKEKVSEFLTIPDKCISNITGNERTTPSDLYDAIGLCVGWLKQHNFRITFSNCQFNSHIGTGIGA